MIRHVVLCRFRRDVSEVAIAQIFAALKALQHQIDGIIAITAG
ncbi:MAG: Dabb family protein, partial [Rhizobiales bacterium]|nr:Dabb family protein [Hyphomicrobiales bacterium]